MAKHIQLSSIFSLSSSAQTLLSVMEGSTTTEWYQAKLMSETSWTRPTVRAALDEVYDRGMMTRKQATNVFDRPAPMIYELKPITLAVLRSFKPST